MFDFIYEWIQNITFYLVLVTAVLHVVPNQSYRKYIRFFTGLVLILMIMGPILKVFGTEVRIQEFISEGAKIYTDYETNTDFSEYGEREEDEIGVEEIQIEW